MQEVIYGDLYGGFVSCETIEMWILQRTTAQKQQDYVRHVQEILRKSDIYGVWCIIL